MLPTRCKTLLAILFAALSLAAAVDDYDVAPTGLDPQIYAVKGLISRLLPHYQSLFSLQLISQGARQTTMCPYFLAPRLIIRHFSLIFIY
jgi:hypothetical protein